MDFRRVLRTTMIYAAATTLIVCLYLTIAYGIGRAFGP
ncbi:MAG: hypothetical protein UZ07_CHB004002973 [Chlorobi bacterium OLB7]|nr:MAG: hypothetical protein UZ07_CHB004002973 [Chlorobi bacterium OLB7]